MSSDIEKHFVLKENHDPIEKESPLLSLEEQIEIAEAAFIELRMKLNTLLAKRWADLCGMNGTNGEKAQILEIQYPDNLKSFAGWEYMGNWIAVISTKGHPKPRKVNLDNFKSQILQAEISIEFSSILYTKPIDWKKLPEGKAINLQQNYLYPNMKE